MSEETSQYDENGNLAYTKGSNGCEIWWKHDKNGNMIHGKNSYGYECWYEYDKNNRKIRHKDTNGCGSWYKYDGDKRIRITKEEFEQKEFLSRESISRFELMEL